MPTQESPDCSPPVALRRDAQRNRAKIMAAARELFATKGIDVSLDDIARHAGVGVATAYRNFANKDVLIDDLLVDRMQELVTLARDGLDEPDPWLGLRGYLDRAVALQAADRGLKQLLFSQSQAHQRIEQVRSQLAPAVAALVERAQAAGQVREDVRPSDMAVINLMVGTVIDLARDIAPDLHIRYLEMLLDGLRSDTAAPPAPALETADLYRVMTRWHHR